MIEWNGRKYPEKEFIINNGLLYGRVSAVLKPFVNFDAIPPEVLESKARLGTSVHDYIQKEINGEFPTSVGKESGYCQSFHKWIEILKPTFLETEMRCYCNQKMITGCIDALVKFQGKKECVLVDWKTSAQESPVWAKQAHLYHYVLQANGFEVAPYFLFIKLDREGGVPKVFNYKFDTNLQKQCLQAIDDFWEKWG